MEGILDRINGRLLAVVTAVVLLAATALLFIGGPDTRTATAHFSRVVSIYEGSDVRIMGVRVGEVTAVVPEGDSVRVELEYDAEYDIPADAKAAIITPTLVSDRFVQLAPAIAKGDRVLADGADIPLDRTASPVELDRIYQSLQDLTEALGPNGVNKDGTLDKVLRSGSKALGGRGELANQTILDMAAAVETFGDNSDPLFRSVVQMAQFTNTLAENDAVVNSFMQDLSGVSSQLAGERQELEAVLVALARALKVVKTFVRDNKGALKANIEELTVVLGAVASEKDALITVLEKGPLGMSNLALAYDTPSGSIGSRVQLGPNAADFDGFLCAVVTNAGIPNAQQVCALLKGLVDGSDFSFPDIGAGTKRVAKVGARAPAGNLDGLLGGGA